MGAADENQLRATIFSCSIISAVSSLSVILHIYGTKKPPNRAAGTSTIQGLFTSSFLWTVGKIFGHALSDYKSFVCPIEAVTTNIFALSGIFWVVQISVFLLKSVKCMPYKLNCKVSLICYGLPTLLTALPLINVSYGPTGGIEHCWIVSKSTSPAWAAMFWCWISFYLWSFLSLIFICYQCALVFFNLQKLPIQTAETFSNLLKKFAGYPALILFLGVQSALLDSLKYTGLAISNEGLESFGAALVCLQGFFAGIIFWSRASKLLWWKVCIQRSLSPTTCFRLSFWMNNYSTINRTQKGIFINVCRACRQRVFPIQPVP